MVLHTMTFDQGLMALCMHSCVLVSQHKNNYGELDSKSISSPLETKQRFQREI